MLVDDQRGAYLVVEQEPSGAAQVVKADAGDRRHDRRGAGVLDHPGAGHLPGCCVTCMELLSLKRSVIYEQLRSGRLRSVTVGRTRLIPAAAIVEYVALLEREAQGRSSRTAS